MRALLSFLFVACGPTVEGEVCDNGLDDDLDGLEDCADNDCIGSCPELCGDAVDNDADGSTDCVDLDCDCVGGDCVGKCGETCGDGRDNDGDGLTDCADLTCNSPACPEVCGDARDNDFDGNVDCEDDACFGASCVEDCFDFADNDGDGGGECDDSDCIGLIECVEECGDLLDNDLDDDIDCMDPDCREDVACPEDCADGIDNDSDLFVDCADKTDCDFYCDADGDGWQSDQFGGPDCDDTNPLVAPAEVEVCDGLDNDCDTLTDQEDPSLDPSTLLDFWIDTDNDGWGKAGPKTKACLDGPFVADNDDDCNDLAPFTFPGNPEVCDGIDNDCVGGIDDNIASPTSWYTDADDDGWGSTFVSATCAQPVGTSKADGDCNDTDPLIGPMTLWLPDSDADGYGAGAAYPVESCDPPDETGWSAAYLTEDCDDAAADVSPSAIELCGDLVDQDCDGFADDCFHLSTPFVGGSTVNGCLFANAGDMKWDNLGSLIWIDCLLEASARGAMVMSTDGTVTGAWGAHRLGAVALNADYPAYATRSIIQADTCLVARETAALVNNLPVANRLTYDGHTWAWEDFGLQYYNKCVELASDHGASIITPWTLGLSTIYEYWIMSQDECNAYNWINGTGTNWVVDDVVAETERSLEKRCMIGYADL